MLSMAVVFWFRAVLGLIALAYLPGFLTLRLVGVSRRSWNIQLPLETAVSLTILMTGGWVMSVTYPLMGISKPLAQMPITVSVIAALGVLLAANVFVGGRPTTARGASLARLARIPWSAVVYAAPAALAPPFAALAATVFGISGDNRLTLCLFLGITFLILAGAITRRSAAGAYPFVVMAISLALVLARTLIGQYVSGWDIQWEYFFAQRTTELGAWNINDSSSQLNSTLSVTVLPTIFTRITGISTAWIFKLVYPLFLGLSAPVMYELYRRYVTERQAFLATLFVMSCNVYYFALPQAVRMEVAFLFLALVLYLIFAPGYSTKHGILTMVCIWGLIAAHYSSAFIFAGWLVVTTVLLRLLRPWLELRYGRRVRPPARSLTVLFTLILSYVWYACTSGGITVHEVGIIAAWSWRLLDQAFALNTHNGMVAEAVTGATLNPIQQIARYLYLGTTALLLVGFAATVLDRRSLFDVGYIALAGCAVTLLLVSVFLPGVSIAYDTGRMYLQASVVLAPFFIVAVYRMVKIAARLLDAMSLPRPKAPPLAAGLSALLVAAYFSFQVGLVNTLAGYPSTVALDARSPENQALLFHPGEVAAASWLGAAEPRGEVYADQYGWMRLISYGLVPRARIHPLKGNVEVPAHGVVYLDHLNVTQNESAGNQQGSGATRYMPLTLPHPNGSGVLATVYDGTNARVMVFTRRSAVHQAVHLLGGGR